MIGAAVADLDAQRGDLGQFAALGMGHVYARRARLAAGAGQAHFIERVEMCIRDRCEETGEPIGIPRLLARPTATLSLEAQERREMRQKLYGD